MSDQITQKKGGYDKYLAKIHAESGKKSGENIVNTRRKVGERWKMMWRGCMMRT